MPSGPRRIPACLAVTLTTLTALAVLSPHHARAAVTYRTVVFTGDPSPGLEAGVSYSGGGLPSINSAGQVAFRGWLQGPGVDSTNNVGIWSEGAGNLTLVARQGEHAPGTEADVVFSSLSFPVLNQAGRTAFYGTLQGPGVDLTNDTGVWSNNSGAVDLIVREGQPVPGTPPGVVFNTIRSDGDWSSLSPVKLPLFNSAGQTAFQGFLAGPDVTIDNDAGIWSNGSGSLSLIAREGSQAPGTEPGVLFRQFGADHPPLGDGGHTAFFARLTGPGVTNFVNDQGIWSDVGGTLTLLARTGDSAPGMAGGAAFNSLQRPVINGAGQIAFSGGTLESVSGGEWEFGAGIWSQRSGSLSLIVKSGDPAPQTDPGVVFDGFSEVIVINGTGKTAFSALLSGPDIIPNINWHGIWVEDDDSLKMVVRLGDQAPGTPTGVVFGKDPEVASFFAPLLNNAGQVAFKAPVTGLGIDDTNNEGIWATSPNGILSLIARKGDLFDVNDDPLIDDFRTIDFVAIHNGTGGEEGRPTSLNDAGQLAFFLAFSDGSSGVFVATIGIPGDLDGDGFVGITDLNLILANWNQNVTPGDPLAGDSTGDGFVGIEDLNAVLGNWNAGTPPPPEATNANIPEPATILLCAPLLPLLHRRCR